MVPEFANYEIDGRLGYDDMGSSSLLKSSLITAMMCGCASEPWPDPPAVDRAAFLTEHATWRSERAQSLRDNWVGLAGLWLLSEGRTAFGTDSSLPIVVAESGKRRLIGTFVRNGRTVRLEPIDSGLLLSTDNHPYRPIDSNVVLLTDEDSVPSYVRFGSSRFWIHLVDDREYVRVMDLRSPRLKEFTPAPEYQPDPRWRVPARFHPYTQPKVFRIAEVTGDDETVSVPGELEFPVRGRQFHLRAFAVPGDSTTLWLMFKDSTNLRDTYGAGRYLWVPAPDSTGWTIIDFNRAVSPPCEYTAYATCPLPPPENRLAAWIEAGEKRAH
jgi:uncharacterized protein (DUF1684 family)